MEVLPYEQVCNKRLICKTAGLSCLIIRPYGLKMCGAAGRMVTPTSNPSAKEWNA